MTKPVESQIEGLASLGEPVRRSLYLYVAGRKGDVSRDEAARAARVSRGLAGFHLDRLVEEGLLEASFKRLSGRAGPGAGRPSKVYRRASRQIEVSFPPRSYELAGQILVSAIEAGGGSKGRSAVAKAARAVGEKIGEEALARAGARPGPKKLLAGMVASLEANGYEPESGSGGIRLRNCPFQALAAEHTEAVCGMNLALIEGITRGLELPNFRPVLDPQPGMCCVRLEKRSR